MHISVITVFTLKILSLVTCTKELQTMEKAVQDVCMHESFNANCSSPEHVILMTSALYGRMRVGRCISGGFSIGCSENVLQYMDSNCTGRKFCNVHVRNLVDIHPCQRDFTSYLEAGYECIKMQSSSSSSCPSSGAMEAEGSSGHIAAEMSQLEAANERCPWKISAEKGQQILIKIIFVHQSTKQLTVSKSAQDEDGSVCTSAFMIKDGTEVGFKRLGVCWGRWRERRLYTSRNHVVFFYLKAIEKIPLKLIIGYEAIGCPELQVPANTWKQNVGVNVMVKCNDSHETWYFACQQNKWVGHVANCSREMKAHRGEKAEEEEPYTTRGVVLAVIAGVVLGVLTGMLLLVVVLCSKQKSPRSRSAGKVEMNARGQHRNLQTRLLRNPSIMKISNMLMQEMTSHDHFPVLLQDGDTNSESSPYNKKLETQSCEKTYRFQSNNNQYTNDYVSNDRMSTSVLQQHRSPYNNSLKCIPIASLSNSDPNSLTCLANTLVCQAAELPCGKLIDGNQTCLVCGQNS